MSNFFNTHLNFKPRSNIFCKIRTKDSSGDRISLDSNDELLENGSCFSKSDESGSKTTIVEHQFVNKPSMESTPKVIKTLDNPNRNPHDEELEITEVRRVEDESLLTDKDGLKKINRILDTGNQSPNDILLEAFTNTQKVCTNLKIELQRQQTENQKQKEDIQNYRVEISRINETLNRYKTSLNVIEEKSKWLFQQKKVGDDKIYELKQMYEKVQSRLRKYHNESKDLNIIIEDLRLQLSNSENDASQKNKELEYLKKELNNYSGQLSEEKIRNSELISGLNNFKHQLSEMVDNSILDYLKSLDKNIKEMTNEILDIKSNRFRLIQDGISNIVSVLGDLTQESLENLNSNRDLILTNLGQIIERNCNIINESFIEKNNELSLSIADISKFGGELHNSISEFHKDIISYFSETFQKNESTINSLSEKASNNLTVLLKNLENFQNNMKQTQEYNKEINELQNELHNIALQKSEIISLMKIKDSEIEELSGTIFHKTTTINELEKDNDRLRHENKMLIHKFEQLDVSTLTQKANFESKLSAQNEIIKLLTEECNELKNRLSELETKSNHSNELGRQNREDFFRVQDQLHKSNIEMVQLKANELELGEQNRELKSLVEKMELDIQEAENELKEVKEKNIHLNKEKHEFITEKLNYQDKVELLENEIIKLGKQISKTDDSKVHINVRECTPSIEKSTIKHINKKDEFDLSDSLNDDLEMINLSPIQIKSVKTKRYNNISKKKLLLSDECDDDDYELFNKSRKRRK